MGRKRKPNGAYKTESVARRLARQEVRPGVRFVTYVSDYGYGFALVGSAVHDELVQGFVGDGLGDRWPARIVGEYRFETECA
jgi:hypothetical protein